MGQYEDLQRLLDALHAYRSLGSVPENPKSLDDACARIMEIDPFDETAIEWKRVSEYEKEIHGGDWPKAD